MAKVLTIESPERSKVLTLLAEAAANMLQDVETKVNSIVDVVDQDNEFQDELLGAWSDCSILAAGVLASKLQFRNGPLFQTNHQ